MDRQKNPLGKPRGFFSAKEIASLRYVSEIETQFQSPPLES